jgi:glycosyltransferase involved in cell wall biosynthesis
LLRLAYPKEQMEIVCVDNNSTDNTPAILREFHGAVKTIGEPRLGAAAARNAGLRIARGQWILFTDSDCVVHTDWCAKLLECLQRTGAAAAGGNILALPGANTIAKFGELIHDHRQSIEVNRPQSLITMNMATRLDLLLRMDGFDERWLRSQDSELSFRMASCGYEFAYEPNAIVYHHNRDTLPSLCREAFIHGYYGSELYRVYAELAERGRLNEPAETEHPPPVSPLPSWQLSLLWKLFRTSKRIGWTTGTWLPPRNLRNPVPKTITA